MLRKLEACDIHRHAFGNRSSTCFIGHIYRQLGAVGYAGVATDHFTEFMKCDPVVWLKDTKHSMEEAAKKWNEWVDLVKK